MKSSNSVPILRIENISKQFSGVLANNNISIDLRRQEIHALLGENGAGKSTLMNIIYGLYRPDTGQIYINGQLVKINSPNDALGMGIGMVHQHFKLIPVMTVTDNLMLGHEKTRGIPLGKLSRLDRKTVRKEIINLGQRYGLEVNPDAYIEDLSVGEAQRVEILKALYKGADILILDEPTAVLAPQEADDLFKIMHSLVEQGKSIIFITHKLKEVLSIAHRISVLRQGKLVGTTSPQDSSMGILASMMVGREVLLTVNKGKSIPKEVVLDVKNLQVYDNNRSAVVNNVSFEVRAGEIYGIAGVQGNGQREMIEALTGLRNINQGQVQLLSKDITHAAPRELVLAGTAHVPEDRQKHGLVMGFPIDTNLSLQTYYQRPFSNGWLTNPEAIKKNAAKLVNEFDIRTQSIKTLARDLSGGNQQKVIIARELSRPIRMLIINQPTRGLDVGSIEFIHNRIIEARDEGVAVLLVSSELDEILSLTDRVGVMFMGRIVVELETHKASREIIGRYMAGLAN